MANRQPLAVSLAGFQFTYRNNYFDWRLLHGIDIDNVIRLTDVQAVEDCLDTLQRGSFAADRDRLSPANCVQLFRLLQLAIEYCAHLRAAHALLLDCYNNATAAAESWKAAACTYLDTGSAFLSESLGSGSLSRGALDVTDAAKAALEEADREYNAALDALESEDSRARHFRFRRQRTEISWSQLHAADADRLVASLDLGTLEGLLPNLTYGSITYEDDEQLTPHHFGQLIPLAQAALDYVLWQANATGALMEQAMLALRTACADVPTLTSATQELHNHITTLLLGGAQPPPPPPPGYLPSATTPFTAGSPATAALGSGPLGPGMGGFADLSGSGAPGGVSSPMAWGSTDFAQQYAGQFGSGRLGGVSGFATGGRATSPPGHSRHGSGGPGGSPQVLRLGLSRLGTPTSTGGAGALGGSYSTGLAAVLGTGGPVAHRTSGSYAGGALDELVAATLASGAGGGGPAGALPVLELHSRAAELNHKVDVIEQDLRLERSKTEEMRRILTDIRDRLNQRPGGGVGAGGMSPGSTTPFAGIGPLGGGGGGGGLSPAESLTFPAGASAVTLDAGMGAGMAGYSAFISSPAAAAAAAAVAGGGSGMRNGSAAGVSVSMPYHSDAAQGPAKVRVFVDEDAIREQERQRAVQLLARQAEKLKQQMLREHQERRLVTSAVASSMSRATLQQLQAEGRGGKDGSRHSRQPSREGRTGSGPRRSSPSKVSRRGSSTNLGRQTPTDYSSDPDVPHAVGMAAAGGGGGYDPRVGSRPGTGAGDRGGSRPPRPLSRLSGHVIHGSLGDLPATESAFLPYSEGRGSLVGDAPSALTSRRGSATGGGDGAPSRLSSIPSTARLAASAAFGSISLVGPEMEAAAAATAAAATAAARVQRSR